ncbi:hypothetical protein GS457_27015, partial [Rhodococcus hoagii]|nr:hypothetical protein [Prescottella equi]
HGDETRLTRICAAVILLTGSISAFDHLSRIVNGVMLSLDMQNAFTTWRSESNDVLFLPAATALAIAVGIPIIAAVQARRSSDSSSAAVITLAPMWKDLSTALPTISLQGTSSLSSSIEREHRMRIECEDALYELLPFMDTEARGAEDLDPVERCAAITDALERRLEGGKPPAPVPAPAWLADEDELLRIADAWSKRPATTSLV